MKLPNLLQQLFAHAASRKVAVTLTGMGMVFVLGVLAGAFPSIGTQLVTVVGGITGLVAIYCTGNVMDGKLQAAAPAPPAKVDPKKAPPKKDEEGS